MSVKSITKSAHYHHILRLSSRVGIPQQALKELTLTKQQGKQNISAESISENAGSGGKLNSNLKWAYAVIVTGPTKTRSVQ